MLDLIGVVMLTINLNLCCLLLSWPPVSWEKGGTSWPKCSDQLIIYLFVGSSKSYSSKWFKPSRKLLVSNLPKSLWSAKVTMLHRLSTLSCSMLSMCSRQLKMIINNNNSLMMRSIPWRPCLPREGKEQDILKTLPCICLKRFAWRPSLRLRIPLPSSPTTMWWLSVLNRPVSILIKSNNSQ